VSDSFYVLIHNTYRLFIIKLRHSASWEIIFLNFSNDVLCSPVRKQWE